MEGTPTPPTSEGWGALHVLRLSPEKRAEIAKKGGGKTVVEIAICLAPRSTNHTNTHKRMVWS
jgi:hypothetical protein